MFANKSKKRCRLPTSLPGTISALGHLGYTFDVVAVSRSMARVSVGDTWRRWRPSLPRGGNVALPASLASDQVARVSWTWSKEAVHDG